MKNDAKIQQLRLTPTFHYEIGRITVCILWTAEGDAVARGVAICSDRDQFCKRTGRNIALGRALQAIDKGKDTSPMRHVSRYPNTSFPWAWNVYSGTKAQYRPMPVTYQERGLWKS